MTDATLGRLGAVTGRARDISVTLTGLSYRQTGAGRRYPYGDFGTGFIETLHKALPAPRHRGVFRRIVCPSCETSLEGVPGDLVTVATQLEFTRIPPVRVEVTMPGITCPGCMRPLVRIDDRDIASDLSDAVIAAFDAAGISPG